MADRRRNPSTKRPPRPAAPLTGAIGVDKETADALALFNARLAAQAENERAQRRIDKATREKDQAAAQVRTLENDPKASAEQRAAATEAYKAALDALERAKRGEHPRPGAPTPDETAPDETAPDETAPHETAPDETAPDETAPEETVPDAAPQVDALEPRDAAVDEAPPGDN
jgi:hypothetical protein